MITRRGEIVFQMGTLETTKAPESEAFDVEWP
jgi:hypothetical protein